MTPDTREWRSSTTYDYLDRADVDALAWECLRRNLDYQRDYAKSIRTASKTETKPEAIGDRWGLRFPRQTQPERT